MDRHAIIAIGANLGDPVATVQTAFHLLQRFSTEPVVASSLWRSDPVDCPPGSPPFINAVAAIVPPAAMTPELLLGELQRLELEAGRQPKKVLNEARPLDLDLIVFRCETRQSPALALPHPRAQLRRFVLAPLEEIAPGLVLPGQALCVRALLTALEETPDGQQASVIPVASDQ
ncbi:MAG: 2-amino-4-hydroxy-6-hydroxymethyldihydropteridine diphosphokinase [Verrucomicrobiales bacterium]|nr:2-amino-4-hydroxy-6-hydroxymethyldihydropteridine diphosphokinase [Verrucomicrobiales bacterium]